MKDKLFIFLKKYPLFLYLLPVFFVLHGSVENYDYVPFKDAILLIGVYLGFSLVFYFIFWLVYKNGLKAGVIAFLLMAFHFFFGTIQDGLRNIFAGLFVTKWAFVLPVSFCLLLLTIVSLKRSKKTFRKLAFYLNVLFVLLILIDLVWLASKSAKINEVAKNLPGEFTACDTCAKPDVYVIIADEYPGNIQLKDLFNFDNAPFINQLSDRGFHVVPASSSNYNYTPYSIASTLDMDYLAFDQRGNKPLLAYAYQRIGNNKLLGFLQNHQYKFYNYSLSDFKGNPAHVKETFLPVKTRLITSQTFLSRLEKELGFHLILRSKEEMRKTVYANKENNEDLLRSVIQTSAEKTKQPKFVLTHLMMPHYPYYFDKNGNEYPFESLIEGNQDNHQHFVEYLEYSNKKLLELVDNVLKNASSPPVIVLMGDHGFRHFRQPVDTKYYFTNLVSVYLPGKNYSAFGDSLSNVNLFRVVLNTTFGQQLHYLKDSTIIMDNP